MSTIDLDALERIAQAATSGPWHWAGNTDTGEPYLATWTKGYGRCQVLAIGFDERSTTGRDADRLRADAEEFDLGDPDELVQQWAYDAFGQPVREPRLEFVTDLMCVNARDLAVYEVAPNALSREDPDVYRADISGIRHPDAEHIASFDPPTALALIARLREAEARAQKANLQILDEVRAKNEALDGRDRYREAIEGAINELREMPSSNPGDVYRILTRALNDKEAEK